MKDLEQLSELLASGNTRLALTLASSFMNIDEVVDFWYRFKRFRFNELTYDLDQYSITVSKNYHEVYLWINGQCITNKLKSINNVKDNLKQVLILAKIFNDERTT